MVLLIADDEALIHKSIEYCVRELPEGSDLEIRHAYNGVELLRELNRRDVTFALVDIQMPGMTGLEALEDLRKQQLNTMIYIMTGFSEFDYARKAVKLGVVEYLLKPLSPEDLQRVIMEVKEQQSLEAVHERNDFRSWLAGGLHRHSVSGLYHPDYYTAVILLTYDYSGEDYLRWFPPVVFEESDCILSYPCFEGILLLAFSKEKEIVASILRRLSKVEPPNGITLFLSSLCHSSDEALKQMRVLLDYSPLRAFYGIGRRYDYAVLSQKETDMLADAARIVSLKDSLFAQNYGRFLETAASVQRFLQADSNSPRYPALAAFFSCLFNRPIAPTREALLQGLQDEENKLLEADLGTSKVEAIRSYIDSHYCEEISIGSLAEKYELSPNYLSSMLRDSLGVKFTEYLSNLRIAKAKEYLATSDRTAAEIAELVGYHSNSHFTRVFSEIAGCTPAEYKKSLRKH